MMADGRQVVPAAQIWQVMRVPSKALLRLSGRPSLSRIRLLVLGPSLSFLVASTFRGAACQVEHVWTDKSQRCPRVGVDM